MPRNAPDDRGDCAICGATLPSRSDRASRRGRPRLYCERRCRDRARRLNTLEGRVVDARRRGRDDLAARIEQRIEVERRIWRGE